jgi:PPOX class probable FMN-dependent enzyme
MTDSTHRGWTEIPDLASLTALLGEASELVRTKARPSLRELDVAWLNSSPFCVVATSSPTGGADASPKGDPAGQLVHVLDDRTIALAERPGNRRADGYRNILENPHVGLVFLIPGRGETLRINGRARLVSDAPFFDELVVKGHRPLLAMVIEIDEVYHHCAKALMRSTLWKPETWQPELRMPTSPVPAADLETRERSLAELALFDGPGYAAELYRSQGA